MVEMASNPRKVGRSGGLRSETLRFDDDRSRPSKRMDDLWSKVRAPPVPEAPPIEEAAPPNHTVARRFQGSVTHLIQGVKRFPLRFVRVVRQKTVKENEENAKSSFFLKLAAVLCIVAFIFGIYYISRIFGFTRYYNFQYKELNQLTLVNFNISHCNIYFDQNPLTPTGWMGIRYGIPGNILSVSEYNEETGILDIIIDNTKKIPELCYVYLFFNKEDMINPELPLLRPTKLPGIDINCDSFCGILGNTKGYYLGLGDRNFTARAENKTQLHMNILGIQANKIHIETNIGNIQLNWVDFTSPSQIFTKNGGILMQTTAGLVAQIPEENSFCFAGKSLLTDFEVLNEGEVEKMEKGIKEIVLLGEGEALNTIEREIILSAMNGDIMVNVLDKNKNVTMCMKNGDQHYHSCHEAREDNPRPLEFTKNSHNEIMDMLDEFHNPGKLDNTVILNINELTVESSHFMRWTVTKNPAYSQIKPWNFALLTGGVAQSKPYYLQTNLKNSLCPYTPNIPLHYIFEISKLINSTFFDSQSDIFISFIGGKEKHFISNSDGFLHRSKKNEKWFHVVNTPTGEELEYYSLSENMALYLALNFSFAVGLCLVLLLLFLLVKPLYKLLRMLKGRNDHIIKYAEMREQFELRKQQDADWSKELEPGYSPLKTEGELEGFWAQVKYICRSIPTPLEFIDHGLHLFVNPKFVNSIEEFLDLAFTPQTVQETIFQKTVKPISFIDITERYEQFCFLNGYKEKNLMDNKKMFEKKEYTFKSDDNTEIYRKVILRLSYARYDYDQYPGETSLDYFIRINCNLTAFPQDYELASKFKKAYVSFCKERRFKEEPVTRSALNAKGIDIDKMTTHFLVPYKTKTKYETSKSNNTTTKYKYGALPGEPSLKFNLKQLDKRLTELTNCQKEGAVSAQDYMDEVRLVQQKTNQKLWLKNAIIIPLHLAFACLSTLPIFLFICIKEILYEPYTLKLYINRISVYDVKLFWRLILKIIKLASRLGIGKVWLALALVGGLFFVSYIIYLLLYYFQMQYPLNTFKYFKQTHRKEMNWLKAFLLVFHWVYILFAIGGIIIYLIMIVEWCILSTIINPICFLPYASMAGTIVAVASIKFAAFKAVHQAGRQSIALSLLYSTNKNMKNVMNKVLTNEQTSENDPNLETENQELFMDNTKSRTKKLKFLQQTPVVRMVSNAGFDLDTLVGMLEDDQECMQKFSLLRGIPIDLLKAIMGSVKNDFQMVHSSITKISETLNIPSALSQIITEISFQQNGSEAEAKRCTIILAREFVNWMVEYISKHRQNKSPPLLLDIIEQQFPQLLTGIIMLKTQHNTEQFIEIFTKMNQTIRDVGNKRKAIVEKENSDSALKGQYEIGTVDDYIHILQLIKLKSEKIQLSNLVYSKVKNSMFKLLVDICKLDEDLLCLFETLFGQLEMNSLPEHMSYQKHYTHIKKAAEKLEVNETILYLLMKMHSKSKMSSKEFINNLTTIIKDNIGISYTNLDLQILFNIFDLIRTHNLQIAGSDTSCGIPKPQGEALICLLRLNKNDLKVLQGNIAFTQIAKNMTMTKNELFGLLCAIIRKLSDPNVDLFLKSVIARFKYKDDREQHLVRFKRLFTLMMSNDRSKLMSTLEEFDIPENHAQLLLVGKNLDHPVGHIDSLKALGISENLQNVVRKMDLRVVEQHHLKKWKSQVIQELLNRGLEKKQTGLFSIYAFFLDMQNTRITDTILTNLIKTYKGFKKECGYVSDMTKFFSIKDIKKGNQKSAITNSIQNLSSVLGISRKLLEYFIGILIEKDEKETKNSSAVKHFILLLKTDSNLEDEEKLIKVFSKYVENNLFDSTKIIEGLSRDWNIPNYLIQKLCQKNSSDLELNQKDVKSIMSYLEFERYLPNWKVVKKERNLSQSLFNTLSRLAIGEFEHTTSLNVLKYFGLYTQAKSASDEDKLVLKKIHDTRTNLLTTLLADDPEMIFKTLPNLMEGIAMNLKVHNYFANTITAFFAMIRGHSNIMKFKIEQEDSNIKVEEQNLVQKELFASDYLSHIMGAPNMEFMRAFESLIICNYHELPKALIRIVKRINYQEEIVDQQIVKGLLSLVNGKTKSLEELAESLSTDYELMETCVILASIKLSRNKEKAIEKLKTRTSPHKIFERLDIDLTKLILLIQLSYHLLQTKKIEDIIETFGIQRSCDTIFLRGLYYITKCYTDNTEENQRELYENTQEFFKFLNFEKKRDGALAVGLFQQNYNIFDILEEEESLYMNFNKLKIYTSSFATILYSPIYFSQNKTKRGKWNALETNKKWNLEIESVWEKSLKYLFNLEWLDQKDQEKQENKKKELNILKEIFESQLFLEKGKAVDIPQWGKLFLTTLMSLPHDVLRYILTVEHILKSETNFFDTLDNEHKQIDSSKPNKHKIKGIDKINPYEQGDKEADFELDTTFIHQATELEPEEKKGSEYSENDSEEEEQDEEYYSEDEGEAVYKMLNFMDFDVKRLGSQSSSQGDLIAPDAKLRLTIPYNTPENHLKFYKEFAAFFWELLDKVSQRYKKDDNNKEKHINMKNLQQFSEDERLRVELMKNFTFGQEDINNLKDIRTEFDSNKPFIEESNPKPFIVYKSRNEFANMMFGGRPILSKCILLGSLISARIYKEKTEENNRTLQFMDLAMFAYQNSVEVKDDNRHSMRSVTYKFLATMIEGQLTKELEAIYSTQPDFYYQHSYTQNDREFFKKFLNKEEPFKEMADNINTLYTMSSNIQMKNTEKITLTLEGGDEDYVIEKKEGFDIEYENYFSTYFEYARNNTMKYLYAISTNNDKEYSNCFENLSGIDMDERHFYTYQGLLGFMNSRALYQKSGKTSKHDHRTNSANLHFLRQYSDNFGESNIFLLERLLPTIHGIIDPQFLLTVSNTFDVSEELIQAYFMSSYPKLYSDQSNISLLQSSLTGIFQKLKLNKMKKDFICYVLSASLGNKAGWEGLAKIIYKQLSPLRFNIIMAFFRLFQWNHLAVSPEKKNSIPKTISVITKGANADDSTLMFLRRFPEFLRELHALEYKNQIAKFVKSNAEKFKGLKEDSKEYLDELDRLMSAQNDNSPKQQTFAQKIVTEDDEITFNRNMRIMVNFATYINLDLNFLIFGAKKECYKALNFSELQLETMKGICFLNTRFISNFRQKCEMFTDHKLLLPSEILGEYGLSLTLEEIYKSIIWGIESDVHSGNSQPEVINFLIGKLKQEQESIKKLLKKDKMKDFAKGIKNLPGIIDLSFKISEENNEAKIEEKAPFDEQALRSGFMLLYLIFSMDYEMLLDSNTNHKNSDKIQRCISINLAQINPIKSYTFEATKNFIMTFLIKGNIAKIEPKELNVVNKNICFLLNILFKNHHEKTQRMRKTTVSSLATSEQLETSELVDINKDLNLDPSSLAEIEDLNKLFKKGDKEMRYSKETKDKVEAKMKNIEQEINYPVIYEYGTANALNFCSAIILGDPDEILKIHFESMKHISRKSEEVSRDSTMSSRWTGHFRPPNVGGKFERVSMNAEPNLRCLKICLFMNENQFTSEFIENLSLMKDIEEVERKTFGEQTEEDRITLKAFFTLFGSLKNYAMNFYVKDKLEKQHLIQIMAKAPLLFIATKFPKFCKGFKEYIIPHINFMLDYFLNNLNKEEEDIFNQLVNGIMGEDLRLFNRGISNELDDYKIDDNKRINNILTAFNYLFCPEFSGFNEIIQSLISALEIIIDCSKTQHKLMKKRHILATHLASAFGVSDGVIRGLFAINFGKFEEAEDLMLSICDHNPEMFKTLKDVLLQILKTLSCESRSAYGKSLGMGIYVGAQKRATWLSLLRKVQEGTASAKELFLMIDTENDSSGGVSVDEFNILLKRLNCPMSEHRQVEIFSKVKRHNVELTIKKDELDEVEFELALKYINQITATSSMQKLKIDIPSLIKYFCIFLVLLLLLLAFIFLGLQAFSIKGPMGSIINSAMPLGAAFGMAQKDKKLHDSVEDENITKTVEEQQKVIQAKH